MPTLIFSEYFPVLIFLFIAVGLSIVILAANWLLSTQQGDAEKLSAYECGFDAFEDARNQFDVRFYLVAILFIVFDLEATFLFPWATSISQVGPVGFWTMFDFLFEILIGFIYAWRIGALNWE